ncbi:hypothetical protein L6164_019191 [Bauhinia variegata]|uniref:Uncharacterized protein n=1 Tax=Bauhinia variegata TaxID=167791 RepID=A0ACB9NDQ5_BAUVA|nr:hypothetical protein L6164_019191 [Bauhinia variegata]
MASQASLLLQKQLKDLCKNPVDGFSAGLVDENNIFEWSVTVIGPPDTLYEGGFFNAIMSFPSNYPNSPPTVKFASDIWHPNVYPDGRVCISILHPPGEDPNGYELASERWTPVHTVESIVLSIISMLSSPNDESPANVEAAKEWRDRRDDFKKKVPSQVSSSAEYCDSGSWEHNKALQFNFREIYLPSVYMGDTLDYSNSSKRNKPISAITGKKVYNRSLIASRPKGFAQRNFEHLVSLSQSGFGSSTVGHFTFFLLKVAALETVRRFSKNRCPYAWRGIQALQILCYPPFKWIQRWAPFKCLIKSMQVLSRPLLVLSIATAFSDQSECSEGTSDCVTDSRDSEVCSEQSPGHSNLSASHSEVSPKILESESWLIQLYKELENQEIDLPERINEDELRRFYMASNNDFSCFLASIKKTIRWRESYRILLSEELEMWSNLVFWHGSDVMHRPCLFVRLGLACRTLASQDKPRFAQAVISQVEYGVLHLVDAENPHITVLVDCEGLTTFKIPIHMMRSCSSLLQDHYPNRLGCLFVIRLPAVVCHFAQSVTQVLKPLTREKLKILGQGYQKVLHEYLQTLPSYLGGSCTCMKCSRIGISGMRRPLEAGTSSTRIDREADVSDSEDSSSSHSSGELDLHSGKYDKLLRTAIISILILWVFVALVVGMYDPASRRLPL